MMLRFITNDNKEMVVEKDPMMVSQLIRTIAEELEDDVVEIPLPNVSHPILELIVKFAQRFELERMPDIPHPLPSNTGLRQIVGTWYNDFITSLREDVLYELIKAGNYMDIEALQELGCARIAIMIKDKSPHEVRRLLGLEHVDDNPNLTDMVHNSDP